MTVSRTWLLPNLVVLPLIISRPPTTALSVGCLRRPPILLALAARGKNALLPNSDQIYCSQDP